MKIETCLLALVLVFAATILGAATCAVEKSSWKKNFDAGKEAFEKSKYDYAGKQLSDARKCLSGKESDSARQSMTLFALSKVCIAQNKITEANKLLNECSELNEKTSGKASSVYSANQETLAELCEASSDSAGAETLYKDAIKAADPETLMERRALFKLAHLYSALGREPDARSLVRRAGPPPDQMTLSIDEYVAAVSESQAALSRKWSESDFNDYLVNLQKRLLRGWYPPKPNPGPPPVTVIFELHKDGTVSNLRIEKGSGLSIYDQALLKAFDNASPFKILPRKGVPSKEVEATFRYSFFGKEPIVAKFRLPK